MKTHLAPTESLTVVIDGAEINVTAQQLLGLKQDKTTDPDEKYRELFNELRPLYYLDCDGKVREDRYIQNGSDLVDFIQVPTKLSAQRVRTYIKMLNIAAKLNGEADYDGAGEVLYGFEGKIHIGITTKHNSGFSVKFKHGLALEALTYLNSEDKIAMFGCDKVKED